MSRNPLPGSAGSATSRMAKRGIGCTRVATMLRTLLCRVLNDTFRALEGTSPTSAIPMTSRPPMWLAKVAMSTAVSSLPLSPGGMSPL